MPQLMFYECNWQLPLMIADNENVKKEKKIGSKYLCTTYATRIAYYDIGSLFIFSLSPTHK